MFRAAFDANTTMAVILAVIAAVNSVIAFFYYSGVAREIWFREALPEQLGYGRPRTPLALNIALAISVAAVLVVGVYPQFFAHLGDLAFRAT
jgi:NADH:ubiquinone oxidoreductase subunit 2 (subunit N)